MTLPPDKLPPEELPGREPEPFLSRWSRLKREASEPAAPAPSAPPSEQKADAPPPELPPLDALTPESDYRGFLHPKVDENLRRAALKKLFTDPHFNVMDGLDVYIDDYSKADPLPAALLAQLRQAQNILDWARDKKEGTETSEPGTSCAAVATGDDTRIEAAELPEAAPESEPGDAVEQPNRSQAARTGGEPADR